MNMKSGKVLGVLLAFITVWSCVKEDIDSYPSVKDIDSEARVFKAVSGEDASQTKTYLGEKNIVYWNEQDLLSVFSSNDQNQMYVFDGETGARGGLLKKAADGQDPETGEEKKAVSLNANYAVYPYDPAVSVADDGTISLELPEVQNYAGSGFGPEANTMVAVTESVDDSEFKFKNVGGYLTLNLYGDIKVKSVTLSGNNGEKLAGAANVSVKFGKEPSVSMSGSAAQSVTVDCGKGVDLGKNAESATKFCFVLPPVTFSKGFTILVTDTEGHTFTKFSNLSGTVERNRITSIAACKVYSEAGQFVRETAPAEYYDKDKVKNLVLEYAGDYIPGGILGNTLVSLVVSLLEKNGEEVLHRIVYTTTDRDGNVVEASGLVMFPTKLRSYTKVLNLFHQTVAIDDAPSETELPYLMCMSFKEGNQVVAMADYLGYGVSRTADLQHPYMHSDLSASACADMFEASMQFVEEQCGLKKGNSLTVDLLGYSQGGPAAISTLIELENRGYSSKIGEIRVGGSPFNLENVIEKVVRDPSKEYPYMEFLPFFFRGMEYAERLGLNFRNIYAQQVFDSGTFDSFDNTQIGSWHRSLGKDPTKVLHPDFFVTGYNSNPDILKIRTSAQRNSVIYTKPKNASKIKIYQSKNDAVVDYSIAQDAKNRWNCSLTELEKPSHVSAGVEFLGLYLAPGIWELVKDLIPDDL